MEEVLPSPSDCCPSSSSPLRLVAADRLFQATKREWNEFLLSRAPENMGELQDLYNDNAFAPSGHPKDIFVWITEHSFICESSHKVLQHLPRYFDFKLKFRFQSETVFDFEIAASSRQNACDTLEYLGGLSDTNNNSVFSLLGHYPRVGICRIPCYLLEKLLASVSMYCFRTMMFTADQGRLLASLGSKTTLKLSSESSFEDGGAAFVQAYTNCQTSGPSAITIFDCLPFDAENFSLILNQPKLTSLDLKVPQCTNQGIMMALARCMREGRGPKELCFTSYSHDVLPSESALPFLDSLKGNTHLESLDMGGLDLEGLQAVPAAVMENKGLTYLRIWPSVSMGSVEKVLFDEVLLAISTHPKIRTLDLAFEVSGAQAAECIQACANMLSVNQRIEELSSYWMLYHGNEDWSKLVTPRLLHNRYLNRFQAMRNDNGRPAIVGKALLQVKDIPALIWLLYTQHKDAIVSFCADQASGPPLVTASSH